MMKVPQQAQVWQERVRQLWQGQVWQEQVRKGASAATPPRSLRVPAGARCACPLPDCSFFSFRLLLGLLLVVFVFVPAVNAQEPEPLPLPTASPTPLPAPPPIMVIAKEERLQINSAGDAKARIRVTIDLASARITRAEQLTKESNYEAAGTEVGSYQALIEDSLTFLSGMKRDSNKTRDLCKRLELALRSHGPRLTTMRRETPLEHAVWLKKAEEFARAARTEVLNTFYGHTVVREPEKSNPEKRQEKPKEIPTPTPKSDQP